jgi:hypothetical protein
VTVPITSGIRQFNLMAKLGCRSSAELRKKHRDRWLAEVKRPNEQEADAYTLMVQILRPDSLVLNPAEIEVEGWTQDQYNDMWDQVLAQFCHSLVVTPDWVFSRGARLEVQRMLSLGRSVTDIFGKTLTKSSFEQIEQQAHRQLKDMGFDDDQIAEYLPSITFPEGGIYQPPLVGDSAFDNVVTWVIRERFWQNKVAEFPDRKRTIEHGTSNEMGAWHVKLEKYFERSRAAGLKSDEGGTNLLVFLTLAIAMLENVTTLYGPLPEPGVKSDVSSTINQLHSADMTPNQRLAMTMSWLVRESKYVRDWFSSDEDDKNTREGLAVNSWWYRQLRKYWHRAHLRGLNTPVGRQQLGKYVSTAFHLAISRTNIWGTPPYPTRKSAEELEEGGFFGIDELEFDDDDVDDEGDYDGKGNSD